jgi:hypothetical protein
MANTRTSITLQDAALAQTLKSPAAPELPDSRITATSESHFLAALWARRYITTVMTRKAVNQTPPIDVTDVASKAGRARTARKLLHSLTLASAQAWSTTETLLADTAQHHGIEPTLINPWQMAADSHSLFQKCLQAYAEGITPQRLSILVAADFARVRQSYTSTDPRILGFVSMQFHYTGVALMKQLSAVEQIAFGGYVKVMDDHLYMPLRDAYQAAAQHDLESPVLAAVQQLLLQSTQIAHAVCAHISRLCPNYASYSGRLSTPIVQTSSIRDVEMFQVYLCVCALEGNLRSVQQELFPLCVMLYPSLGVSWELVRAMLRTITWEVQERLTMDQLKVFQPYLKTLTEIFSIDLLEHT